MGPGTNAADAPVAIGGRPGWLLELLRPGFTLLAFGPPPAERAFVHGPLQVPLKVAGRDFVDTDGLVARRYDARPGTVLLFRPDQHLAARWRRFDAAKVHAALARCLGTPR